MLPGASLERQLVEAIASLRQLCVPRHGELGRVGVVHGGSRLVLGAGKKLVATVGRRGDRHRQASTQIRGDLAAGNVADLLKVLKNDALRGAAAGRQTLFCMSTASQDDEKRACIHDALHQGGAPAPFAEVAALSDLDDDQLSNWRGLFVGMPYGQRFAPRLIAPSRHVVRGGGQAGAVRLRKCGEAINETNLNQLGYHFGVAFNSDIVVERRRRGLRRAEAAYVARDDLQKGLWRPASLRTAFTSGAPLLDQGAVAGDSRTRVPLHLEPAPVRSFSPLPTG
jgi:hypothetical protein